MKKKEKESKNPKVTPQTTNVGVTNVGKVELDPTKYFDNRKDMIIERKKNENPFPHKFEVSMTNGEFIDKFGPITKKGEWLEDSPVSIAGRVYSIRSSSAKLKFYDIISDNKQIQVYCNARYSLTNKLIAITKVINPFMILMNTLIEEILLE